MKLFDCHCHTKNSHDSSCDPIKLCEAAIAKGLGGIAITDHCDIEYAHMRDVVTPIESSLACASLLKEKYAGKLLVICGIEIGEGLWNIDATKRILENHGFDIVLGSAHAAAFKEFTMPFSGIDFSAFSYEDVLGYCNAYFDEMIKMLSSDMDFDVLCHLTNPWRYITGKYKIEVDVHLFDEKIEKILSLLIDRNIAYEVNTSIYGGTYSAVMQEIPFLKKYFEMGGYLITLGADSHIPENVGIDFERITKILKDIGFTKAYYYQNRKAVAYDL